MNKVEIAKATEKSILDYCNSHGIPLQRNSTNEYQVKGTKIKISAKKNMFTDWDPAATSRIHSGNVLNFIQYVDKVSFTEAVYRALGTESTAFSHQIRKQVPFSMPKWFQSDTTRAKNYLVKQRKISPEVIDSLIQQKLIKETRNGEICFIWKDQNQEIGGTLQGTEKLPLEELIQEVIVEKEGRQTPGYVWGYCRPWKKSLIDQGLAETREAAIESMKTSELENIKRPYKKQILENSPLGKGNGFYFIINDEAQQTELLCFEASIDAISFYDLYCSELDKDTRYVFQSLEGVNQAVVFGAIKRLVRDKGRLPNVVRILVDNDEAGDKFYLDFMSSKNLEYLVSHGVEILRDVPTQGKDWNELLQITNQN